MSKNSYFNSKLFQLNNKSGPKRLISMINKFKLINLAGQGTGSGIKDDERRNKRLTVAIEANVYHDWLARRLLRRSPSALFRSLLPRSRGGAADWRDIAKPSIELL